MSGTLGTLFVVATPIGNLEDVTLRALTISLHEHNERSKTPSLIERLTRGESIALVSDAGTPVVSDPGAQLVAAAHAAGVRVEPIPGPSALLAAISSSGFGGDGFLFLGFPPSRAQQRRKWLSAVAGETRPLVLYEAPHRIRDTLEDMKSILGDRTIALGRELTKAHEELVVRPISQMLESMRDPKGEYTVVIAPADGQDVTHAEPSVDNLWAEFGQLTDAGALSRREVVRQLAEKYGLSQREVYARIEDVRKTVV
jgi:16S rRNA (cytidine1402-2'-O)-methyltransferase